MDERHVFTVTELNNCVKELVESVPAFGDLLLKGEISNYKVYPSGHHYFTLKDSQSALRCVMFKGSAAKLRFRPENGMQVIASGRISVYPRDGAYQLYCSGLSADGVGDLYVAFEQLKDKLYREGLFDPAHKKPLPRYPRRILLMGGAEGAGNFVGAAHALLAATECQLTIVCGRNKKLKTHLEKTLLPHDGARARVLGFVSNMREEMAQADLIVMRGSPNSAMEAAAMNKPLIITDSLPGQEADNPKVLAKHGLCILQPDPDALPETIRTLFDPSNPTLKRMREAQRAYMDPACASRIAQRIADSIGRQPRDRSGAVVRS